MYSVWSVAIFKYHPVAGSNFEIIKMSRIRYLVLYYNFYSVARYVIRYFFFRPNFIQIYSIGFYDWTDTVRNPIRNFSILIKNHIKFNFRHF